MTQILHWLQQNITTIAIGSAMAIFIGFGVQSLGAFETTDEHFWKYDRIQKYYNGWSQGVTEGEWKKTRINDKPGVTVALLAGTGLPFVPHPEYEHRDTAREEALRTQYDTPISAFHADITQEMNFGMRLPFVLFGTVMLIAFYWIVLKFTAQRTIAIGFTLLIATMPALIGMSRVMNPDAVLWSTMSASILAYFAFLRTQDKKLGIATAVFAGLALLSKYTASLLFLLLPIALLLFAILSTDRQLSAAQFTKWMQKNTLWLSGIFIGACTIFSIGLPAVFGRLDHFLYGTFLSPALESTIIPLAILYTVFLIDVFVWHARGLRWLMQHLHHAKQFIIALPAGIFVFFGVLSLINIQTQWLPLNHLKETGRVAGELAFPQIVFDSGVLHSVFVFLAQMQNFFFSLPTLTCVAFMFVCGVLIFIKPQKFTAEIAFAFMIPFVFFAGGTVADVFVNVRYGIILYPFAVLLIVLTAWEVLQRYEQKRICILTGIISILTIGQIIALYSAKPFYLTYENAFLPQEYFVADGWSDGIYKAAEHLNALPNAENMIVWSDSGGDVLCQSFVGACIRAQKVDLDKVWPEYIVITRRRSLIRPIRLRNEEQYHIPSVRQIYAQEPVWSLYMNDRPDNFVKVIKFPERVLITK